MFENVRILGKYLSGKTNVLELRIPDLKITRVDSQDILSKIMSIDPEKRKGLRINKSTLWYQQKKIKEGNIIKVYGKTKVKIE